MYKPGMADVIGVLLQKKTLVYLRDRPMKINMNFKNNPQVCIPRLEYASETTICHSRIVKTFAFSEKK